MSGFEHQVAASTVSLMESLSFKLPDSANYVTRRRDTTWYPTGSSTVSPTGVKTCRFLISGQDWLDPSDLTITFTVANLGTARLYPQTDDNVNGFTNNGGSFLFFDRVRVFASGELIDDQLYANRTEMMIRKMLPTDPSEP